MDRDPQHCQGLFQILLFFTLTPHVSRDFLSPWINIACLQNACPMVKKKFVYLASLCQNLQNLPNLSNSQVSRGDSSWASALLLLATVAPVSGRPVLRVQWHSSSLHSVLRSLFGRHLSRPVGPESGSLVTWREEWRGKRHKKRQQVWLSDQATNFIFSQEHFIAKGQGEGRILESQVCWNSGLEASLGEKKRY